MKAGIVWKASAAMAIIVLAGFLGITGNQLVEQNKALSIEVGQLAAEVQKLRSTSKTLQAKIETLEDSLEPRYEKLANDKR